MSLTLPRGIWFEEKYARWRVRLYRSGKAHLAGYFKTYEEASSALAQLKERLAKLDSEESVTSFKGRVAAIRN